ncbi:Uu.00g047320.m01.CDS01 [Anthostomella pinea]|uniref:Uu.00g047320.m01.CDS01 n=1 Tax=Anthostomella pinea TaxID=933095 RepID=A0AAI8VBE3_9PEZI|nr:Uu.00g047320.m01.CDS01 [Anthostomella pinea]
MASPGAALAPAPTAFDNAGVWHNITSWTVQHLRHSVNVTRYAPSLEDLILAGPRILTRLGSIISFPDAIDGFGQRVIPDPTGSGDYFLTTTTAEMAADVSEVAANLANVLDDDQDPAAMVSRFSMEGGGAKGLGSVFSYATSKWALCCIAMAIILNRTHIFAASRRRLRLTWPIRVLLRVLPIVLFVYQARQLLQAIQCQTSPDFAEMRWGNSAKTSDLMFAHPGGYLHGLSSTLLFGATDYDSCRAINMIPSNNQDFSNELRGSLSQLWPLFGTLCLSQFLETISCSVQGRLVAVETGMTLFEHSLAFAEADSSISNQLGWGIFSSGSTSNVTFQQASGANIAISRSMIMKRVNTPPEVLLVAFISAMSHITSHVLGIFDLQSRFRLFSTGFWAICFMGSLFAEALNFSLDDPSNMGLFRFPTVCIIGFIPHVMVLAGIMVCFTIYSLALVLAALEPPDSQNDGLPLTFSERVLRAHENMQANVSLADIRISRALDFYTALLRTGFGVITMASEAVYLNEDRNVNLKRHTWLEEERYRELESLRTQWASGLGASRYDSVGTIGMVPIKDDQIGASTGYARERAAQSVPKSRVGDRRSRDGVGAAERSSRWLLALEFLMNINRLLLRWSAFIMLKGLARIGITRRPSFLVYLSRGPVQGEPDEKQSGTDSKTRARLGRHGRYAMLLNDENVDVEAEVRRRLERSPDTANIAEKELDTRLYDSWKHEGLWGTVDTSGDWEPNDSDDEWDTTSMIHSVVGDNDLEERDRWIDKDDKSEAEGQRTPTQGSFSFSRETTPLDQLIDMKDLARLLHPTSPDDTRQAHTLAAHLTSDRIVTRAQFARMQHNERGRLLTTGADSRRRHAAQYASGNRKLSDDEEAKLLEQLMIARRNEVANAALPNGNDDGPQCVVCHSAPRKIIVWPCRCLSLCDECRVTLAMNNFDKCVCCRREVISFSRIYVP